MELNQECGPIIDIDQAALGMGPALHQAIMADRSRELRIARLSSDVVEAAVAELEHRNRWGYDLTKLETARIDAVQALIAARKEFKP